MDKNAEAMESYVDHDDPGLDTVVGEKSGTNRDVLDMKRLGKSQLFKVCNPLAIQWTTELG
jgi:hypothetical protein